MSRDFDRRIARRRAALEAAGLSRTCPLPTHRQRGGVEYRLDGRAVVGFCSNDYLGMARLLTAGDMTQETPCGAGASRLICGDSPAHRGVEQALARLVGCEDAVLFSSGFSLNVGALPALLERGDRAWSDALNHASIIDGLRLARASGARVEVLPHGATPPQPESSPEFDAPARWWITEAIYSMDGDRCRPAALAAYMERGGFVYVDEAHALGLFPGGAGLTASRGVRPTVVIGTLGKAFGCAGAFAAGSRALAAWLRATARSFVFSTGVSPLLVEAVRRATELVAGPVGERRRARLWANIAHFGDALGIGDPRAPIVPIHVGDNRLATDVSDALRGRGWHVQAIRPPTVPPGGARLRVTLSADHTREHVEALAHDLRAVFGERDLPLAPRRAS